MAELVLVMDEVEAKPKASFGLEGGIKVEANLKEVEVEVEVRAVFIFDVMTKMMLLIGFAVLVLVKPEIEL